MIKKFILLFATLNVAISTSASEINLNCSYDHLKGTDKDKPFSVLVNPELKQGAIKGVSAKLHTDGELYWFTINKLPSSAVDFREQYQINRKNLILSVKIFAMNKSFTGLCEISKQEDNKI
ncbi:MAG: hypothetical protein ACI8WT_004878 [Clostridium sp.]|jgi:hypothetical protein